jgi:pimeloyl-ACP methyl ester carboxylesterase
MRASSHEVEDKETTMSETTTPTAPKTRTIDLPNGLAVSITEFGENTEGNGVLMLHGGAGPRTMAGISAALSQHVYVVTPTHPGFDGTPRPGWCDSIGDLASAYLDLLDALDLTGVMVIGNSVGGWIASEMALRDNHGRVGAVVLVNAVGIHAVKEENRVLDVRRLDPADIGKYSFAKEELRPDFSTFTPEQRAAGAANQKTLAVYGGEHFTYDPKLRSRLHRVELPVLVVWGEEDRVAPLGYGRGFAGAFPNGHFTPIKNAGHLPQIEELGATLGAIGDFVDNVVKPDQKD